MHIGNEKFEVVQSGAKSAPDDEEAARDGTGDTLRQLRAWADQPTKIGVLERGWRTITRTKSPVRPSDTDLIRLVQSVYPFRPDIRVDVRSFVQKCRDVYFILSEETGLNRTLDERVLKGSGIEKMVEGVTKRAAEQEKRFAFWKMVASDMPWKSNEDVGAGLKGAYYGLKPAGRDLKEQLITRHPFFNDIQLVSRRWFVLTLSSPLDVNYIDKGFPSFIHKPQAHLFDNIWGSALGRVFHNFAKTGTSTWPEKSADFFALYLATELLATPNTLTGGNTGPSVEDAYYFIVQDLKRLRDEEWTERSTVNLVRDFVAFKDELAIVVTIMDYRKKRLTGLRKDVDELWSGDVAIACARRVEWARSVVDEHLDRIFSISTESKRSLDALFQLHSIEQNELTISADGTSKVVLLFTGTTTIFLPLSFFASSFGMNFQTIRDTNRSEGYFWSVCGSITFIIVLSTLIWVFRSKLRVYVWNRTANKMMEAK
ncbi:hypothetical protein B0J11DRAFT_510559 [Dendryphion nanum]|uniref:Uncharacterized protein n=1 Tax=Dendryphion nanum TaxID=256645 RepID=A0A9P9DC34_9PLEO|nr:hypothetical protein B0J11DRAFT_510559 [Dendryphion nanum]